MQVTVTMYNIGSGGVRWHIPNFLSDGNRNVCSICHRLQDIRKSIKYQKSDLLNKGPGKGEKLSCAVRSTANFRFYIGDFFQNFNNLAAHSYTERYAHTTRDRVDDYRQNLQSRFAQNYQQRSNNNDLECDLAYTVNS